MAPYAKFTPTKTQIPFCCFITSGPAGMSAAIVAATQSFIIRFKRLVALFPPFVPCTNLRGKILRCFFSKTVNLIINSVLQKKSICFVFFLKLQMMLVNPQANLSVLVSLHLLCPPSFMSVLPFLPSPPRCFPSSFALISPPAARPRHSPPV